MFIKKQPQLRNNIFLLIALLGIATTFFLIGCESKPEPSASSDKPIKASIFPPPPDKSGAQIWADNCSRCHNYRDPGYYSPSQWGMIVHHMRLRANLTGEEQRKVTEFLQAAAH